MEGAAVDINVEGETVYRLEEKVPDGTYMLGLGVYTGVEGAAVDTEVNGAVNELESGVDIELEDQEDGANVVVALEDGEYGGGVYKYAEVLYVEYEGAAVDTEVDGAVKVLEDGVDLELEVEEDGANVVVALDGGE